LEAYEKMTGEATDDAEIVEKAGYKVKLYMGTYQNIKLTTSEDMRLADTIGRSLK
jgi:2-C-methyl-D-erythritol 4-phosphate cytidylyltransferase